MRLWSLHPRYLDSAGIVALWREALLARKVLQGRTKGYRSHPQLDRFRNYSDPLSAMEAYLYPVYAESLARGYRFDPSKVSGKSEGIFQLPVTEGQMAYEWDHLLSKVKKRNPSLYSDLKKWKTPEPHPLFKIVPGDIAPWEKR